MKRPLSAELLQKCCRETVCTASEVRRAWALFCIADKRESGVVSHEDASRLPTLSGNPLLPRLLELSSSDGSGAVGFQEFLQVFCVFHPKASAECKAAWAFAVWDFDGLSHEDEPRQSLRRADIHDFPVARALLSPVLATGDDSLGAGDLKEGLWLLSNGSHTALPIEGAELELFGSNPTMFEEAEGAAKTSSRRESRREDLLSLQEVSQVLVPDPANSQRKTCTTRGVLSPETGLESVQIITRIASEIDPIGSGISFDEFRAVVLRLPDFAAHLTVPV